jgi:Tfp pilus assembly protein FimT
MTLVEMMFVLVVFGILIALAVPAMGVFLEKSRLKGAAEAIFSDLSYARSEALKRNQSISASFTTDGALNWCYGLSTGASCDCTITDTSNASACTLSEKADGSGGKVLKTVATAAFPKTAMPSAVFSGTGPSNVTVFNPTRGTAKNGTVKVRSTGGKEIHVILSTLGRTRICSPSGASTKVAGYPNC